MPNEHGIGSVELVLHSILWKKKIFYIWFYFKYSNMEKEIIAITKSEIESVELDTASEFDGSESRLQQQI